MHDKGAAVMSEEYMEKNPIQVADRLFGAVELLASLRQTADGLIDDGFQDTSVTYLYGLCDPE